MYIESWWSHLLHKDHMVKTIFQSFVIQKHKTDSIFHHQVLTYYHDIKMAGIFIDENQQITFITTLELHCEIHYDLLKIGSIGFRYLGNLISQAFSVCFFLFFF